MFLSRNSTSECVVGDSTIKMKRLGHLTIQIPRDDGKHIAIEDKFMAGSTYGLRLHQNTLQGGNLIPPGGGGGGGGSNPNGGGSRYHYQNIDGKSSSTIGAAAAAYQQGQHQHQHTSSQYGSTDQHHPQGGAGTALLRGNGNGDSSIDQSENRHYYRERIANWKILAANGDSNSALNIGIALFRGELGVTKDPVQAVQYFRIAASAGNPIALFNIGWAYCQGTGVVQSWPKAIKWWTRAAKLGHSSSARNIALLYSLGIAPSPTTGDAKIDHDRAVYWYQEAARLGNPKAMLALAGCYKNGLGVEVDMDLAEEWERKGNNALQQQQQQPPPPPSQQQQQQETTSTTQIDKITASKA